MNSDAMGSTNKHAFISTANFHVVNLILNLIQGNIIKKSKVILILDTQSDRSEEIIETCKGHKITANYWDEIKNTTHKFLTINSISLQFSLAKILTDCLEYNLITSDRINILITDDEVTRWLRLYQSTGKLELNELAKIDNNVLKILSEVDNYITPYESWGKNIEMVVGRKLNILDAVLPFSILDYASLDNIGHLVNDRIKYRAKTSCKVLLFTQSQNQKETFNIAKSFLSGFFIRNNNTPVTLGLWITLDPKGLLYLTRLKVIIKLRKLPVNINIEQRVPPEHYAIMLYNYDSLILQSRGGFSTGKYFAEHIGKVITLSDTPNDKTLKLDYQIDTFSCDTYLEALEISISLNQASDEPEVIRFANSISKRHNSSLNLLKKYWNNFYK